MAFQTQEIQEAATFLDGYSSHCLPLKQSLRWPGCHQLVYKTRLWTKGGCLYQPTHHLNGQKYLRFRAWRGHEGFGRPALYEQWRTSTAYTSVVSIVSEIPPVRPDHVCFGQLIRAPLTHSFGSDFCFQTFHRAVVPLSTSISILQLLEDGQSLIIVSKVLNHPNLPLSLNTH